MKFAGVELTAESIRAAHRSFADNARACIEEVKSGAVSVNVLCMARISCGRT